MAEMKRSIAGLAEKDGSYFLARRKPGGDLGGLWELPGGKLEPGESPREAMKREWMEELTLPVEVGRLLGTGRFFHHGHEFLLELYEVRFTSRKMELFEHVETGWFSKEEIENLPLADSDRLVLSDLWEEVSPPDTTG